MKPILRIIALWRFQAGWLLLGIVVSLLSVGSAVALMLASGSMLTAILGGTVLGGAAIVPVLLRVLGPARVVLRYLERLVTHGAMFRALADLRVWFFSGLAKRSAGGLGFRRAGDMLSRLVNDIEALDGLYLRIVVPGCAALLLLPAVVLFIGQRDPNAAVLVGGLFILAAFLLPALAARLSAGLGAELARSGAALRVAALDTMSGLREIRAYGAEQRFQDRVAEREAALLGVQARLGRRSAVIGAAAFLCGQAAVLVLLLSADARPGFVTAALFLTIAAFEAVGLLPRAGVLAGHVVGAARRVLNVASGPLPPDPIPGAPPPSGNGLRFEHVGFRWSADRPLVFDGLNLDIPQGTRVAIIGPSGAGKSSLAALALRVAEPERGRVTLGGTDLRDLQAAAIRGRIAWLSQATHLFTDTIRANLLLGRPDADEAALWNALDRAAIGDLIRSLPEGLDSWVGEGGARFSGGQGRRLVLARALLSQAPILILDEPCAGLDAETERAFLTTLFATETAAGRTIVLISHRLMGVERLDRIWRISAGHAMPAMA